MARNSSNLNIVHVNIRSLRANFEQLLLYFQNRNFWPEIIVLSEIWVYDSEINFYKIYGYNSFSKCNNSYRSGGVVIYYRENLTCRKRDITFKTADVVQLILSFGTIAINIVGLYRIQKFQVNNFIDELSILLDNVKSNTLIIGDVNLNLLSSDVNTAKYIDLFCSYGFTSLINQATRIDHGVSATCIDHALLRSNVLQVHKTSVIDCDVTDHMMVELCLKTPGQISKNDKRQTFSKFLPDNFQINISDKNFQSVTSCETVNLAANTLNYILTSTIAESTVNLVKQKKRIKPEGKPWMSANLYAKVKKKYALINLKKDRPFDTNLRCRIKHISETIKKQIKKEKSKFYSNKFQRASGNSKIQWQILNELSGSGSSQPNTIEIEDNDKIEKDPNIVANLFNNYFVSAPQSVANEIQNDPEYDPNAFRKFLPTPQLCSMYMNLTTEIEISKIIERSKNGKAPGWDGIRNEHLKLAKEQVLPAITHVFNLIVAEGTFPETFKKAQVVPIFKNDNPYSVVCHRPVSLLSSVNKLIEKLISERLDKFLTKTMFFSTRQFGFRPGKSTEMALQSLTSEINQGLNNDDKVATLSVDIEKAFDCCKHEFLLDKLENAGVRGVAKNVFRDYLNGRTQQVLIKGKNGERGVSDEQSIKIGVFQGSQLGPLLFLIYINDLLKINFKGKLTVFADDLSLTYRAKSWNIVHEYMSYDLKLLREWFTANQLRLSIKKTKYLLFSARGEECLPLPLKYHKLSCTDSSCNCELIEQVKQLKYLGVIIDNNLSWIPHVKSIQQYSRTFLRKLYYLRPICPENITKLVYTSLLESKVSYALSVWGGTYETNLKPIITSMKHAIRIICKKNRRHRSFPLFQHLECLPFKHLYIYKSLRLFFKICGNFRKVPESGTRSMDQYVVPRPYKTLFTKSFDYVSTTLYNKLPLSCKNSSIKNNLTELKKHLLLSPDPLITI